MRFRWLCFVIVALACVSGFAQEPVKSQTLAQEILANKDLVAVRQRAQTLLKTSEVWRCSMVLSTNNGSMQNARLNLTLETSEVWQQNLSGESIERNCDHEKLE